MRWPLKYQIMVPMTVVMLGTVVAVSVLQAYLAADQTREQTSRRIRNVTSTLAGSTFRMSNAVLEQMKGLAGADFVLQDAHGEVVATTRSDWQASEIPRLEKITRPEEFELAAPVTIKGERLFHAAIAMRPQGLAQRADRLHVFYSESVYLQERRRAALPSVAIGGLAIVLVILLALLTAWRVSRPLGQLREQVKRVARGDFQPMPLPRRDDEVRDLSSAVNQMAETLSQYEQQIRRTEQVRLLAQLGGGLAHQLRNSATGARMALDIHRGECQTEEPVESLEVATRQLVLMEKYLARFLALGASHPHRFEQLDFAHLVNDLLSLVQPAARHTGVALQAEIPDERFWILGDSDALDHMVLNLLLNAIEAAGQMPASAEVTTDQTQARKPQTREERVWVSLRGTATDRVVLIVEDTGPGPPAEIVDTMFEPFVTAKKDGVGLGLAVAREVAAEHHGQLCWERTVAKPPRNPTTRFTVEIPIAGEGNARANAARS